jgi:UDP-N-acetylglucosamine 4-epimerase
MGATKAAAYEQALSRLREQPRKWAVTGGAGFIGSNLVEALLRLGQRVVALDNFSTGYRHNLDGAHRAGDFEFIEGDIRRMDDCAAVCRDADFVLHQAALGSVPRSIADPLATHEANLTGFLNMLIASRDAGVRRFVYAASSSTYGDAPGLPKVEDVIGKPLSPYAVTKLANELYAQVFATCYGVQSIGLRYFNVFGPRQDPDGAYAAVIPRWIGRLMRGEEIVIYGDGETSRDFCYIENVIQANVLAATAESPAAANQIYNIAVGERTTLNELFHAIRSVLVGRFPAVGTVRPSYADFRAGDVRHSLADVSKAAALLGYVPTHPVGAGLQAAIDWYTEHLGRVAA